MFSSDTKFDRRRCLIPILMPPLSRWSVSLLLVGWMAIHRPLLAVATSMPLLLTAMLAIRLLPICRTKLEQSTRWSPTRDRLLLKVPNRVRTTRNRII